MRFQVLSSQFEHCYKDVFISVEHFTTRTVFMDVQSLSPVYSYQQLSNSSIVKYHFQLISPILSYGMQFAQVCVYNICMHVYINIYVSVCVYTYVCMCVCVCVYIHTSISMAQRYGFLISQA